ncbi:hypothetical protein ONZ51_g6510 [Trametes cubensis]|uniref:C3H1-type domain-containing protein n=1 Tax=Trametes cubensis TaxID=1111947 RepID=A0AAD7TU41_9APHY|nr:hypothetical protein ONZ51_g6510 [Trametes cubensis]
MNGGYVRDRSGQSTTTCGTPSPQNPKYRTKLCRNFPLGTCRYGEHCSYLHISTSSSPALSAQYPTFPNLSTVAQTIFQPCNNLLYNNAMFNEPASAPLRHADHVEQWRLSVDTARDLSRLLPPAPPTTPISTAVSPAPSPSRPRVAQHEWRQSRADRPDRAQPSPPQRPETSRPGRPSASSIVRQQKRNQFFRTKPCRFFSEPAGCVKGDRCNFIHESPGEGSLPTGLTVPATEALSDCEGESATESSIQGELSPSTAATSEPPSCGSTQTEEPKKNFYPVTWRVVGGGVTLGGKREICESFMAGRCTEGADCRYAHPDTNDEDGLFGYPEPPMFAPFSPLSPMSPISPVLVPYPFVYPMVSPPTILRPTCHPRSTAHDATSHYATYTHSQGPAQREEQLDGRHQRGTADRDVPVVLSTSRRRRRDTPPHGQPPRRQRDGRQGRGQAAVYPADAGAWSRREYCKGEESSP